MKTNTMNHTAEMKLDELEAVNGGWNWFDAIVGLSAGATVGLTAGCAGGPLGAFLGLLGGAAVGAVAGGLD